TQFDLRPHMESFDWTEINAGIQQHLQKAYNTNKAAFKAQHWIIDPMTRTYNVEKIKRAHPENITASKWDKGGKQRGHIPGVGRVLLARAIARPSTPAHESTLNSLHKKMDFIMSLFKSDSKYSDMFSQFDSGGASESSESFHGDMSPGNMCRRGTNFLTGKYVGPTVSLGKESLASIPQRTFSSDKSPGKAQNCRWGMGLML
nr:F-box domain, leucine-rich repeat domain, L domain-like protein [Tanacetum cinerariifolium]